MNDNIDDNIDDGSADNNLKTSPLKRPRGRPRKSSEQPQLPMMNSATPESATKAAPAIIPLQDQPAVESARPEVPEAVTDEVLAAIRGTRYARSAELSTTADDAAAPAGGYRSRYSRNEGSPADSARPSAPETAIPGVSGVNRAWRGYDRGNQGADEERPERQERPERGERKFERPDRKQERQEQTERERSVPPPLLVVNELYAASAQALLDRARELGVEHAQRLSRGEQVSQILRQQSRRNGEIVARGLAELHQDGHGFLRLAEANLQCTTEDIFIPAAVIRQHGLRSGDEICGSLRAPREKDRSFALNKVDEFNGVAADQRNKGDLFEQLTPVAAHRELHYSAGLEAQSIHKIGGIKAGERILLRCQSDGEGLELLRRISAGLNEPGLKILLCALDQHPEESTRLRRCGTAVVASTQVDDTALRHVQLAELVFDHARRIAEGGGHALVLLDSATTLARSYGCLSPHHAKYVPESIDPVALTKAKRLLATGRQLEEGGSVTLVALAHRDGPMASCIMEELRRGAHRMIDIER